MDLTAPKKILSADKYLTMRNLIDLIEAANPQLAQLKKAVIGQVQKTDDAELLDKIYTSLNKSNLAERISKAISHDKDAASFIHQLVQIIIDTPGTYQEKLDFCQGFPNGYVDVKKMISGARVHFDELLVPGKNQNAPMGFVRKVFHALKRINLGTEKGPGEFALAVMSPQIRIFGKGDLHIGNLTIEVKASAGSDNPDEAPDPSKGGGRLGTSGWLNHSENATILSKYFPNLDTTKTLGLTQLGKMAMQLEPKSRKKMATELFGSIFKNKKVDVGPVVAAMTNGEDPNRSYVGVSYRAYQQSSKFDGMMLINFPLEELKYFRDPEAMADEIYSPSVAILSSNEGFAGRNILPAVTLAPEHVEKVDLKGGAINSGMSRREAYAKLTEYATYLVKSMRIRDPNLIKQVSDYLMGLWDNGMRTGSTLTKHTLDAFPQLKKRQVKVAAEPNTVTPAPAPQPGVSPNVSPGRAPVRRTVARESMRQRR
jgi:hypothetical protein